MFGVSAALFVVMAEVMGVMAFYLSNKPTKAFRSQDLVLTRELNSLKPKLVGVMMREEERILIVLESIFCGRRKW